MQIDSSQALLKLNLPCDDLVRIISAIEQHKSREQKILSNPNKSQVNRSYDQKYKTLHNNLRKILGKLNIKQDPNDKNMFWHEATQDLNEDDETELDHEMNGTEAEQIPQNKRKQKIQTKKEEKQQEQKPEKKYFWPRRLHKIFMRFFSEYGKSWKDVSEQMNKYLSEVLNNIEDKKDQLQCRTHGQKYL